MIEAGDDGEDVKVDDDGTKFRQGISNLKDDVVIGVAVQCSDLPMMQFCVNGEFAHAINRFRGTMHPSVCLRGCDGASARLIVAENELRHEPAHSKHGPSLMAT